MFKSVFSKYMLGFICIFLSSFICFGAVVYGYMTDYVQKEAVGSVQSAAHSTKIMMDTMWQNYVEKESQSEDINYNDFIRKKTVDIRAAMDGIAKFTGVGILVLNEQGRVSVTTVRGLEGKRAPEGFLGEILNSKESQEGFTAKDKRTVGDPDEELRCPNPHCITHTERGIKLLYKAGRCIYCDQAAKSR
jgi:hypothetical protein